MKCEEIRERFDDFLMGEAEPSAEILINEHLLECEACRREIEERESAYAGFREPRESGPPASAWRRIKPSVRKPAPIRKPYFAHWTFRVAALAATFILGMVLMRGVDAFSSRKSGRPAVETGVRPYNRIPYADTVKFYSAPAKNLARI